MMMMMMMMMMIPPMCARDVETMLKCVASYRMHPPTIGDAPRFPLVLLLIGDSNSRF
jgi:hypothetical protein